MTDRNTAKFLMVGAIIYLIAPDLFPGPVDDVLLTILAAMNLHHSKKLED